MSEPQVTPAIEPRAGHRLAGFRLFGVSFAALFLELMVIRWAPAVVHYVAYYGNLMLISSFLGLGIGAMMAQRKWDVVWLFPVALMLDIFGMIFAHRVVPAMPTPNGEARFNVDMPAFSYLVLVSVFVLNTAVFVPLGQRIGQLFGRMKPLAAYGCDLGGSLCGTVAFGLFSFFGFSPAIGMAIVAGLYLIAAGSRKAVWSAPLLAIVIVSIPMSVDPAAIWSPYHYITISPMDRFDAAPPPPTDLRTMTDPPIYHVRVNTDLYQQDGTIDPHRYSSGGMMGQYVSQTLDPQYFFPYRFKPSPSKVCILGAGGGLDVEAALLSGAQHVDAVEIDPVLVRISRAYSAADVYDNPKVSIHVTDARAFLQSAAPDYDLIAFGLIDSHALFSYSNNVRLDGYIYTVQSIRQAYSRLKPDGILCVSFLVRGTTPWLGDKLKSMIAEGTGKTPVVYKGESVQIFCVPKDAMPPMDAAADINGFKLDTTPRTDIDVPTDDWPYLYLSKRAIPNDYLIIIGTLLAISAGAVIGLRVTGSHARSGVSISDAHFFFLGLGFLLLETKSIGDCSLYFGNTWLVTMIVVTGVLTMVLAANLLAMRLKRPSSWLYLPLLITLAGLYFVNRDMILGLPMLGRFLWAIFIMPLPIFFAGLIFSTTFREEADSAALFGANLIGATIGGFLEYLGMAIGTHALLLIVVAAYVLSLMCRLAATGKSAGQNLITAPA